MNKPMLPPQRLFRIGCAALIAGLLILTNAQATEIALPTIEITAPFARSVTPTTAEPVTPGAETATPVAGSEPDQPQPDSPNGLWYPTGMVSVIPPNSADKSPLSIPYALQPWLGWVLHRQTFYTCPLLPGRQAKDANDFVCAWPGELQLAADAQGAQFDQSWHIASESWVPLPGNTRYWPQQVTINGEAQPVLNRQGSPALFLSPGDYRITGYIPWFERPQTLTVPYAIALVALQVDGKPVLPVQRRNNELTLGRIIASVLPEALENDNLELQVFRKLSDGIPAQLETEIRFHVSGKARELTLGPVLPPNFAPLSISSPWAARLNSENRLQIQVQPGNAILTLRARATQPFTEIAAQLPPQDWVTQEVWSYEAYPDLRMTTTTPSDKEPAAFPVDAHQAEVPAAWQTLPAFAMQDRSALQIKEHSRGLPANEINRLTLNRQMWLDFDGGSFFARDFISGSMRKDWRFDIATPYKLERAGSAGFDADVNNALLITQGSDANLTGVEWHNTGVNLSAGARTSSGAALGPLPITGWQQTFDAVDTTLYLPYGYRLIAAPGAETNDTWIEHWSLPRMLFVAFGALIAWWLLGFRYALIVAAYMTLAGFKTAAPMWALLLTLLIVALADRYQHGSYPRLCRWSRRIASIGLLVVALPFIVYELRLAANPRLDPDDAVITMPDLAIMRLGTLAEEAADVPYMAREVPRMLNDSEETDEIYTQSIPAQPMPAEADRIREFAPISTVEPPAIAAKPELRERNLSEAQLRINKAASEPPLPSSAIRKRYSQSNVVQTGAGEPAWTLGQHHYLHWEGPVLADQTVRLLISPPWLTRLAHILTILLLAALLWRLMRGCYTWPPAIDSDNDERKESGAAYPVAVSAAALVVGVLAMLTIPGAQAQTFPPDETLTELHDRLTEAPRCAPDCASIARAEVSAGADELEIILEAHAGSRVALPLPTGMQNIALTRVLLDGDKNDQILHQNDTAFIALERGVHFINLRYAISGNRAVLRFASLPKHVVFASSQWVADGFDEGRLLNETVNLSRLDTATVKENDDPGVQRFPPYVRVIREIRLDLDWTTETMVSRQAPDEGGIAVPIPLLDGEHVTTPNVKIQERQVIASLANGERLTRWQARFDKKGDTLRLHAPDLGERPEVWRIIANPSWHINWEGVPVTLPATRSEDQVFEFHPLPGETLTVNILQPVAMPGPVRAIDNVRLAGKIEGRATTYDLYFTMRASQGGEHTVSLPNTPHFEVLDVKVNNASVNLRPTDGKLTIPILPGKQTIAVSMRDNGEPKLFTSTPAIDLGLPAANIDLRLTLPNKRWLIATTGPATGPTLFYWGNLVIALLAALLLAKRRMTVLRGYQWPLLVIGFSWLSWTSLIFVTAALLAAEWLRRTIVSSYWSRSRYNLTLLGFSTLTAIAVFGFFVSLQSRLSGYPKMGVVGHGSNASVLNWFADRSESILPVAGAVSLPLWVYQAAILLWLAWFIPIIMGRLRAALPFIKKYCSWQRYRQARMIDQS